MQFERMEPWEGLDIDDSDLKAFLKKCNSTATLIPGPAGNVQAAMLNRQTDEPKSTQEFVNDIAKATFDRDFKSNPWIWAEKFIKHHDHSHLRVPNVVSLRSFSPSCFHSLRTLVLARRSGRSFSPSCYLHSLRTLVAQDARPQSLLPPLAQDARPRSSLRTLVRTPCYLHSLRTLVLAPLAQLSLSSPSRSFIVLLPFNRSATVLSRNSPAAGPQLLRKSK
ncbi:hypothetical protein LR48_Vigan03g009700 [Vigna angularis]|uniref:Uncharacterized protein n=1 Tax=Phaseolus angularis TaxID=3914 RepID=A0A0L9U1S3_PHAAN|nr:hypothetical protein LR48_Vigan03g009700 [Vigna angularis]